MTAGVCTCGHLEVVHVPHGGQHTGRCTGPCDCPALTASAGEPSPAAGERPWVHRNGSPCTRINCGRAHFRAGSPEVGAGYGHPAAVHQPAQNPATPMVVGADGRAPRRPSDGCTCGHNRNWHTGPTAATAHCRVCECQDFYLATPPAQQPAGPDVDTAAIRATVRGDIPVTALLLKVCDALDARDAEIRELRAQISTRRYLTHEACERAHWDGIRKWRDEATTQLLKRDAARGLAAALEAELGAVRRALDDELANLADDGARPSHAVVRRIEAVLDRALREEPADA